MGKRGREIVKLDLEGLLEQLNKAFADEWLAYYQYWIGAKVAVGPMRGAVVAELMEHALDELRHADMLIERIIQLGGTPILKPEDWYEHTNCGYAEPSKPSVKELLNQNIEAEQCAIDVYTKILELTKDKDPITYNLALEILADEVEHEEDLQALVEDMMIAKDLF
ncbi:MAG: ferritin [Candidatus Lokiarchaeota archaeon]|nr:ferritin [Candidatus Lokiarchaeota archaeon]